MVHGLHTALTSLLQWRYFPGGLQGLLLLVTAALLGYAFLPWGRGESNLATALVWQVWWPLLPVTAIVAARLWCALCPFPALGDWVQARQSSPRSYPLPWLRRHGAWLGVAIFLSLGAAFLVFQLESNPPATGGLLLAFGLLAVMFALAFRGRGWCRFLCPVGILLGVYSLLSLVHLRAKEGRGHDPQGRLVKACPVYASPLHLRSLRHCHLCAACLRPRGGASVEVALEAPWQRLGAPGALSLADAVAIALLWGFILADTLRMTPWYPQYMAWALPWHGNSYKLATLGLVLGSVAAVLALWSAAAWLRGVAGWRSVFTTVGVIALPLALGGQLALSAQHLWGGLPVAVKVLFAELGLGSGSHMPPSDAYFVSLPLKLLQLLLLAVAAYVTVRLFQSQRPGVPGSQGALAVALPSLLLFFLYGQPMSGSC